MYKLMLSQHENVMHASVARFFTLTFACILIKIDKYVE